MCYTVGVLQLYTEYTLPLSPRTAFTIPSLVNHTRRYDLLIYWILFNCIFKNLYIYYQLFKKNIYYLIGSHTFATLSAVVALAPSVPVDSVWFWLPRFSMLPT